MSAPTLRTERLILRPFRAEDHAPLLRIWSEPRTLRHFARGPLPGDEVWTKITRAVGHWHLMGYGYWAVIEKTGGALIGEVGFADFRRGIAALDSPYEAGWVIDPDRHGQGFGREAVLAAQDWLDRAFDRPRCQCLIAPGNDASLALARRAGYATDRLVVWRGGPSLLLERPAGSTAH